MPNRKLLLCITLLMPAVATAQTGNNEWEGEAELGFLMTSGNTEETKLNSRVGLKHEITSWRNTAAVRTLYSETEESGTTAEEYNAEAETNWKFNSQQFLFLRGGYDDDRFSGYDFQASSTAGYGNRVWESGDLSFLELKAGVGYRYNRLETENDDGEQAEEGAIVRFAGAFNYELSSNALFIQQLSTEIGLKDDNTISESFTGIKAELMNSLSMKVGYRVKHQSDVPPETENTNTETSVTLLYGF